MTNEGTSSRSSLGIVALAAAVALAVLAMYSIPIGQAVSDDKIHIVVSILPQKEFAEEVGGEHVSITVMVPPGQEPHTYAPKPNQMVELEQADLYFKIGAGIEFELTWMDRFIELNPGMLVVDSSESVELIDTAGGEGAHDPHIWLSPKNAAVMVENLRDGLKSIDPSNSSDYDGNAAAYIARLESMGANISVSLSSLANRNLLTFHPAWAYFAQAFNLSQTSIESEGKEPSALDVAEIIDFARHNDIHVIFAEPQFSTRTAEQIASEIDGAVVLADDLAEDYVDNLQRVADAIAEGLG